MMSAVAIRSSNTKGRAASIISLMENSGATPFMVNRERPKGGVSPPKSTLIKKMTPNYTGSKPSSLIMGIKIGRVIITILTASTRQPRIKRMICMMRFSLQMLILGGYMIIE